jgi:threonine dehydratase
MPVPSDSTLPASPSPPRLSLARIDEAAHTIEPCFLDSPLRAAPLLSRRLGCTLRLKDETGNPVGSFKGRGADFLLACAGDRLHGAALVCASAGNFGLALAHACARRGVPLTVFVAHGANPAKVAGIRARGATVVAHGTDFDAAKLEARAHAARTGARFVEDGVDPEIGEGAGTIGRELLRDGDAPDAVLVPLGNGALLAGIARWLQAHAPRTRVIGVCSAGAPVMAACFRAGGVPESARDARADTIADGIAVRVPVPEAVQDLRHGVHEVVCVPDAALPDAMRAVHEDTGLRVEPSAVVGIAAIAADPSRYAGRRVVTLLTGANLAPEQIARWYA